MTEIKVESAEAALEWAISEVRALGDILIDDYATTVRDGVDQIVKRMVDDLGQDLPQPRDGYRWQPTYEVRQSVEQVKVQAPVTPLGIAQKINVLTTWSEVEG